MELWTNETTLKFINEFLKHQILWNKKCAGYSNPLSRHWAYEKIRAAMNIANFDTRDIVMAIKSILQVYDQFLKNNLNPLDYLTFEWCYLLHEALQNAANEPPKNQACDTINTDFLENLINTTETKPIISSEQQQQNYPNQFDQFGQNLSKQLQQLPITTAVKIQKYIEKYMEEFCTPMPSSSESPKQAENPGVMTSQTPTPENFGFTQKSESPKQTQNLGFANQEVKRQSPKQAEIFGFANQVVKRQSPKQAGNFGFATHAEKNHSPKQAENLGFEVPVGQRQSPKQAGNFGFATHVAKNHSPKQAENFGFTSQVVPSVSPIPANCTPLPKIEHFWVKNENIENDSEDRKDSSILFHYLKYKDVSDDILAKAVNMSLVTYDDA